MAHTVSWKKGSVPSGDRNGEELSGTPAPKPTPKTIDEVYPNPYTEAEPPVAYKLKAFQHFWKEFLAEKDWEEEPGDSFVPEGFVGDFVLSLKGVATTTLFSIWAGLFTVSSVIRRAAYIEWFPSPLVANLYVILSAPPGALKKTTLIDYAGTILRGFPYYLSSVELARQRQLPILQGEITPEALHYRLAPEDSKVFSETEEEFVTIEGSSQIAILASELSNLLDARSYKEGLVGMLTSLYDGRIEGDERHTRKDGSVQLKNIYVTLLGGLTPDQMRNLPEIVLGGGFMSRTILVHQESPTRIYPIPRKIPGAPSIEDLQKRLAWIAEHVYGTYYLTQEAYQFYSTWYEIFLKDVLNPKSSYTAEQRQRMARMDTVLLRTALLLRAQRYEVGNDIELQDIRQALSLLNFTYRTNRETVEQVSASQQARVWSMFLQRILAYIQRNGTLRRPVLLSYMHKWGTSKAVSEGLQQLHDMGCIRIRRKDGTTRSEVSSSTSEVYEFVRPIPALDELDRLGLKQSWEDSQLIRPN